MQDLTGTNPLSDLQQEKHDKFILEEKARAEKRASTVVVFEEDQYEPAQNINAARAEGTKKASEHMLNGSSYYDYRSVLDTHKLADAWEQQSDFSMYDSRTEHFSSRVPMGPDEGLLLKSPFHESYAEMVEAELELGNIIFSEGNREYSLPVEQYNARMAEIHDEDAMVGIYVHPSEAKETAQWRVQENMKNKGSASGIEPGLWKTATWSDIKFAKERAAEKRGKEIAREMAIGRQEAYGEGGIAGDFITDPVAGFAGALESGATKAGTAAMTWFMQSTLGSLILDPAGERPEKLDEWAAYWSGLNLGLVQDVQQEGFVDEMAEMVTQSATSTALGLAAGAITRNPGVAYGVMTGAGWVQGAGSAVTRLDAYQQEVNIAREAAGLKPDFKLSDSMRTRVITEVAAAESFFEAAGGALGINILTKGLRKAAGKSLIKATAANIGGLPSAQLAVKQQIRNTYVKWVQSQTTRGALLRFAPAFTGEIVTEGVTEGLTEIAQTSSFYRFDDRAFEEMDIWGATKDGMWLGLFMSGPMTATSALFEHDRRAKEVAAMEGALETAGSGRDSSLRFWRRDRPEKLAQLENATPEQLQQEADSWAEELKSIQEEIDTIDDRIAAHEGAGSDVETRRRLSKKKRDLIAKSERVALQVAFIEDVQTSQDATIEMNQSSPSEVISKENSRLTVQRQKKDEAGSPMLDKAGNPVMELVPAGKDDSGRMKISEPTNKDEKKADKVLASTGMEVVWYEGGDQPAFYDPSTKGVIYIRKDEAVHSTNFIGLGLHETTHDIQYYDPQLHRALQSAIGDGEIILSAAEYIAAAKEGEQNFRDREGQRLIVHLAEGGTLENFPAPTETGATYLEQEGLAVAVQEGQEGSVGRLLTRLGMGTARGKANGLLLEALQKSAAARASAREEARESGKAEISDFGARQRREIVNVGARVQAGSSSKISARDIKKKKRRHSKSAPPPKYKTVQDLFQVPEQEFTSVKTIVGGKSGTYVPALFNDKNFVVPKGAVVANMSAGTSNAVKNKLESEGAKVVYNHDPFARTEKENKKFVSKVSNGRADVVTSANGLNVIQEKENRQRAIAQMANVLKDDGTAYISVYEKGGDSDAQKSGVDSWQEQRKTDTYVSEIEEFFDNVTRKGKMIIATSPKMDARNLWTETKFRAVGIAANTLNLEELDPSTYLSQLGENDGALESSGLTLRDFRVNKEAEGSATGYGIPGIEAGYALQRVVTDSFDGYNVVGIYNNDADVDSILQLVSKHAQLKADGKPVQLSGQKSLAIEETSRIGNEDVESVLALKNKNVGLARKTGKSGKARLLSGVNLMPSKEYYSKRDSLDESEMDVPEIAKLRRKIARQEDGKEAWALEFTRTKDKQADKIQKKFAEDLNVNKKLLDKMRDPSSKEYAYTPEMAELQKELVVAEEELNSRLGLERPTNKKKHSGAVLRQRLDIVGKSVLGVVEENHTDAYVEGVMAQTIALELQWSMEHGGWTADNWYEQAITKMWEQVARMDPTLTKDSEDGALFTMLLAMLSDGERVSRNLVLAVGTSREYKRTGKLIAPKKQRPAQFFKFEALYDKFGSWKAVEQWMSIKSDVRTINNTLKEWAKEDPRFSKMLIKGELQGIKTSATAYNSYVIGPKLGAFYMNNLGVYDPLTQDLWFARSFFRLQGMGSITGKEVGRIEKLSQIVSLVEDGTPLNEEAYNKAGRKEVAALMEGVTPEMWGTKEVGYFHPDVLNDAGSLNAWITKAIAEFNKKTVAELDSDGNDIAVKAKDQQQYLKNPYLELHPEMRKARVFMKLADNIHNDKKGGKAAPTSGGVREQARRVMLEAMAIYNEKNNTELTSASAQAMLWYFEKEVYANFSGEDTVYGQDFGSQAEHMATLEQFLEHPDAKMAARALANTKGGMSRDKRFGVGKRVGNNVYMHSNYIGLLPEESRKLIASTLDSLNSEESGWSIVKYNTKTEDFSLIKSTDFDTANEPRIEKSVKYNKATGVLGTPRTGSTVYHHKWLFVDNDYKGFDVEQSMLRTDEINKKMDELNINRSTIGSVNNWNAILNNMGMMQARDTGGSQKIGPLNVYPVISKELDKVRQARMPADQLIKYLISKGVPAEEMMWTNVSAQLEELGSETVSIDDVKKMVAPIELVDTINFDEDTKWGEYSPRGLGGELFGGEAPYSDGSTEESFRPYGYFELTLDTTMGADFGKTTGVGVSKGAENSVIGNSFLMVTTPGMQEKLVDEIMREFDTNYPQSYLAALVNNTSRAANLNIIVDAVFGDNVSHKVPELYKIIQGLKDRVHQDDIRTGVKIYTDVYSKWAEYWQGKDDMSGLREQVEYIVKQHFAFRRSSATFSQVPAGRDIIVDLMYEDSVSRYEGLQKLLNDQDVKEEVIDGRLDEEYLGRLTGSGSARFSGGHMQAGDGESNILHIRGADWTDQVDGANSLFVFELQSDWFNKARSAGFKKDYSIPELYHTSQEADAYGGFAAVEKAIQEGRIKVTKPPRSLDLYVREASIAQPPVTNEDGTIKQPAAYWVGYAGNTEDVSVEFTDLSGATHDLKVSFNIPSLFTILGINTLEGISAYNAKLGVGINEIDIGRTRAKPESSIHNDAAIMLTQDLINGAAIDPELESDWNEISSEMLEEIARSLRSSDTARPYTGPFVSNASDNLSYAWLGLGVKRSIAEAVLQGKDKVVFTTREFANTAEGIQVPEGYVGYEKIPKILKKIANQVDPDAVVERISEPDLQTIPITEVPKSDKEWGVWFKIEQPGQRVANEPRIRKEYFGTRAQAESRLAELTRAKGYPDGYSLQITEKIRDSIMKGVPMFGNSRMEARKDLSRKVRSTISLLRTNADNDSGYHGKLADVLELMPLDTFAAEDKLDWLNAYWDDQIEPVIADYVHSLDRSFNETYAENAERRIADMASDALDEIEAGEPDSLLDSPSDLPDPYNIPDNMYQEMAEYFPAEQVKRTPLENSLEIARRLRYMIERGLTVTQTDASKSVSQELNGMSETDIHDSILSELLEEGQDEEDAGNYELHPNWIREKSTGKYYGPYSTAVIRSMWARLQFNAIEGLGEPGSEVLDPAGELDATQFELNAALVNWIYAYPNSGENREYKRTGRMGDASEKAPLQGSLRKADEGISPRDMLTEKDKDYLLEVKNRVAKQKEIRHILRPTKEDRGAVGPFVLTVNGEDVMSSSMLVPLKKHEQAVLKEWRLFNKGEPDPQTSIRYEAVPISEELNAYEDVRADINSGLESLTPYERFGELFDMLGADKWKEVTGLDGSEFADLLEQPMKFGGDNRGRVDRVTVREWDERKFSPGLLQDVGKPVSGNQEAAWVVSGLPEGNVVVVHVTPSGQYRTHVLTKSEDFNTRGGTSVGKGLREGVQQVIDFNFPVIQESAEGMSFLDILEQDTKLEARQLNGKERLVSVTAMKPDRLLTMLQLGGLPLPSVGTMTVGTFSTKLSGFGSVYLMYDPEFIQPENSTTYNADIYSARSRRISSINGVPHVKLPGGNRVATLELLTELYEEDHALRGGVVGSEYDPSEMNYATIGYIRALFADKLLPSASVIRTEAKERLIEGGDPKKEFNKHRQLFTKAKYPFLRHRNDDQKATYALYKIARGFQEAYPKANTESHNQFMEDPSTQLKLRDYINKAIYSSIADSDKDSPFYFEPTAAEISNIALFFTEMSKAKTPYFETRPNSHALFGTAIKTVVIDEGVTDKDWANEAESGLQQFGVTVHRVSGDNIREELLTVIDNSENSILYARELDNSRKSLSQSKALAPLQAMESKSRLGEEDTNVIYNAGLRATSMAARDMSEERTKDEQKYRVEDDDSRMAKRISERLGNHVELVQRKMDRIKNGTLDYAAVIESAITLADLLPSSLRGDAMAKLSASPTKSETVSIVSELINSSLEYRHKVVSKRLRSLRRRLTKLLIGDYADKMSAAESSLSEIQSDLGDTSDADTIDKANKSIDALVSSIKEDVLDSMRLSRENRSSRLATLANLIVDVSSRKKSRPVPRRGEHADRSSKKLFRRSKTMMTMIDQMMVGATREEREQIMELLHHALADAESNHLSEIRGVMAMLDKAAVAAGYKNFDRLLDAAGTTGVHAVTKKVKVTLGNREVELTLDELMKLQALDEEVVSSIVDEVDSSGSVVTRGVGIQLGAGRNVMPIQGITRAELEVALSQLPSGLKSLVETAKEERDSIRALSHDAHFAVHGTEPRHKAGQEPVSREDLPRDTRGLKLNTHTLTETYLEESGYDSQDTEGGAVVIGGFLADYITSTEALSKLAHIAVATRDAISVVMSREVRDALNISMGSEFIQDMHNRIMHASGVTSRSKSGVIGFITGGVARAVLTLRPQTWMRILGGGVANLTLQMHIHQIVIGVSSLVSMKSNLNDAWSSNGYLFGRSKSGATRRQTQESEQSAGKIADADHLMASAEKVARSLAHGVNFMMRGNFTAWKESMGDVLKEIHRLPDSIQVLQMWDNFVVAIAYGGMLSQYKSKGLSGQDLIDAAAKATERIIRQTQNTSSAVDATVLDSNDAVNNTSNRSWFPFGSDPLTKANTVYRAIRFGTAGERVLAVQGFTAAIAINAGVTYGYAMMFKLIASMFREDEEDKLRKEAFAIVDRAHAKKAEKSAKSGAARDIVGQLGYPGMVASWFMAAGEGYGVDAPMLWTGTVQKFGDKTTQLVQKSSDEEATAEELLDIFKEVMEEVRLLLGDITVLPQRDVRKAMALIEPDYDELKKAKRSIERESPIDKFLGTERELLSKRAIARLKIIKDREEKQALRDEKRNRNK